MAERQGGASEATAFTRKTQHMLTAIRMIAYSFATLFMIVMVYRGVSLTTSQMEAEADRSIRTAVAVIEAGTPGRPGSVAALRAIAPAGVRMWLENGPAATRADAAADDSNADVEVRRVEVAAGRGMLVAAIDHAAISRAALRADFGYILFVQALGLPVIAIFLYMGWAVNRPALELLAFAQAGPHDRRPPPALPAIWNSVLARLKQLKDSQSQMQAFLDNAPIGMMFRDAAGNLAMINRYGASFYELTAEELEKKPISWFNAYFPDSAALAQPLFLGPLGGAETTVETEFHGPAGERMNLLIKSFPVIDDSGAIQLIGNFFVDVTDERRARDELVASRNQFESFVRNAPAPMIVADMGSGRVVMANDEVARCYGLTVDQLQRTPLEDTRASWLDWDRDFIPMFDEVREKGVSRAIETRLQNAETGEVRTLLMSNFAIPASEEARALLGSISTDITDLRAAEAGRRETQAQLQGFFDHVPFSMTLHQVEMTPGGLDGRLLLGTKPIRDFYESIAADLGSLTMRAMFRYWPEFETWQAALNETVAKGEPMRIVTPYKFAPDAEERLIDLTIFPIRSDDGQVVQMGSLGLDVTDQRRAEAALAAQQVQLHQSEKLAALGQLLAGVSHELNNPLAAVIGQASLLAEDLEGTAHAERVGKIRRAADRCARIVQSFLAMARQKAPEYRTLALADLVRQAVELTEYQMRAANVTVRVDLEPRLPPIEADPDQFHQVLVNLLTNARQALDGIAGERSIGIVARRTGAKVRLRIADTGRGIPRELRGRIFDPFFTTKDIGTGTGIGLSFSLGIVEAHGRTLELEESDVGTVFAITLPAARQGAAADPAETAGARQSRGRALVIDDEADIADTLGDMLTRMGLDVTAAIGGKAGLAALDDGARYDLILSDIRMPDVDGLAIHAWIGRNRPDLLGALAFVTGDTLGGEVSAFLAGAGCPVLEKPFTAAALRALVQRMIEP